MELVVFRARVLSPRAVICVRYFLRVSVLALHTAFHPASSRLQIPHATTLGSIFAALEHADALHVDVDTRARSTPRHAQFRNAHARRRSATSVSAASFRAWRFSSRFESRRQPARRTG